MVKAPVKYAHMFEFLITICTLGNPCVTLTDTMGTRYPTHSACVREAQSRQVPILLQMLEQGYRLEHTQITCHIPGVRTDS